MRICLLTKRYYTGKDLLDDRYGRLYHLPKHWSEQGAKVDVIALDYRSQKAESFQSGNLRMRAVSCRGFHISPVLAAIGNSDYDLIVASGHLNIGHLALRVGRCLGIPVVFDVYDYYPAFHARLSLPLRAYFRWLLPRFDGVMTVSRKLEAWCLEIQDTVCRIPNGVDRKAFIAMRCDRARAQMNYCPSGPVLGIFGSLSKDLGAEEVVASFEMLRAINTDAELLVAGSGGEHLAENLGVRYLGRLDQSELVPWASCCDLLLIPYRNSLQVSYSQSARLAEYLALERPVVVTRVGDALTWFPQEYRGLCETEDPESMLAAIKRQIDSPDLLALPPELEWGVLGQRSYEFLRQLAK